MEQQKKRIRCQVMSRVCGYFAPLTSWNVGKQQEYKERRVYVAGPELDVEMIDAEPLEAVVDHA